MTVFSFFTLCVISDFFSQLLLGFAPPSLSVSNPTIPARQLHTTFMTISTQPPSSRSFLQTAPKSGWPVFASRAIQGPFPWTASPKRCEGSLVQGPAITWLALRWAKSTGAAEPPGPPARQPQGSKSSGEGLAPSTLSCSQSSCSTQGGMPGRHDLYGFWQADCRVIKTGHLKSTASNTQETTARQSFCRR